MGYIIPFPSYKTQNYQERVTRRRVSPYFVEQPYQATSDYAYKDMEKRENDFEEFPAYSSCLEMRKQTPKSRQAEKMYSEITGKGKYVNESI